MDRSQSISNVLDVPFTRIAWFMTNICDFSWNGNFSGSLFANGVEARYLSLLDMIITALKCDWIDFQSISIVQDAIAMMLAYIFTDIYTYACIGLKKRHTFIRFVSCHHAKYHWVSMDSPSFRKIIISSNFELPCDNCEPHLAANSGAIVAQAGFVVEFETSCDKKTYVEIWFRWFWLRFVSTIAP